MGTLVQLGNHAQFRNGATFSLAPLIAKLFKERVQADGGVFEAQSCLINLIENI